ncbi:HU family DNA-binding protein [Desulfothermus okinawensis JCM 13304]
MNKSELIKAFAKKEDLSIEDATLIVNIFFDSIKEALKEGRRVEIRGFGSFKIKEYDGYIGRNPSTGQQVEVKPKRLPFFRVGKELKEFLNS